MSRAEICIPRCLKHEGGFVNHPDDPGGATNLGITLATFRRYIKPKGTVADLKALTVEQATIIYKRQYWDAVVADMLPVGVDYAVVDFAINSGPTRAAKFLQRIVGVKVDGKIGPATLAAVNRRQPEQIVRELCARRMEFLRQLRHWPVFGDGWTNRVNDVLRDALNDLRFVPEPLRPAAPPERGGWLADLLKLFMKG